MKIRKFNESERYIVVKKSDVVEFFIDFNDEGTFTFIKMDEGYYDFYIYITCKPTNNEDTENFDKFLEYVEENTNTLLDIKECIEKLQLKYEFDSIDIRQLKDSYEIRFALE